MTAMPGRPVRRIVLSTAASVTGAVLLLSLKPHTTGGGDVSAAAPAPTPSAGAPSGADPSAKAGTGTSGTGTRSGSGGGTKTVDGDTVQTRYGPVQLRITLTGGKITQVSVLQAPSDNPRDAEITGFAVPQLTQEALAAQSARIDTVSGATYTSEGYLQSLQSALDKAGA
jgi:uncharacterized protein with FMN-binding domain